MVVQPSGVLMDLRHYDDYDDQVRQIASVVLGQSTCRPRLLGQGASSIAWRVESGSESVVVRIMPCGVNRPITYRSEFTILRSLRKLGQPVPEPLCNSMELRMALGPPVAEAWSVTRTVEGKALARQPVSLSMSPPVVNQLGEFLAALHSLPACGYGRLEEKERRFLGQHNNIRAAVIDRWRWGRQWPFSDSAVETHPYVQIVPESLTALAQLESKILQSACEGRLVVNHSDLHGEHIFVQDDKLTGIIDFGAAFVGVPGWDFASIAHSYGWSAVEQIATGYTASDAKRKQLLDQAQLLALVISMYKLSKASQAGAPSSKVERLQHFITETLARVSVSQK